MPPLIFIQARLASGRNSCYRVGRRGTTREVSKARHKVEWGQPDPKRQTFSFTPGFSQVPHVRIHSATVSTVSLVTPLQTVQLHELLILLRKRLLSMVFLLSRDVLRYLVDIRVRDRERTIASTPCEPSVK